MVVLSNTKMPRRRRALLLTQRESSDDEFETPAFKDIDKKETKQKTNKESDSEEEIGFNLDEDSSELSSADDVLQDDVADDDDDDAPEDIGFQESREVALSRIKQVMTQMKEEKVQQKNKRKMKDELFKEQKHKKLEALTRLSQDIVNSLPEKLNDDVKSEVKLKTKNQGKKRKKKSRTESGKLLADQAENMLEDTGDFIPLETGFVDSESGIRAVPLKQMRKQMAIPQSAANFRHERLYGDTRQRESTRSYLDKLEKSAANRQR